MPIVDTLCPECGSRMVSRKHGDTGQVFWGCRRYPECIGTRNTDGEAPTYRRVSVSTTDYRPPYVKKTE